MTVPSLGCGSEVVEAMDAPSEDASTTGREPSPPHASATTSEGSSGALSDEGSTTDGSSTSGAVGPEAGTASGDTSDAATSDGDATTRGGPETSGDPGTTTSDDPGTTTGSDLETTTSGDPGTTTGSDPGTTTSGDPGTTSGDPGTTTNGDPGATTSGDLETTTSGDPGTTTSGDLETTTGGDLETTTGGDAGTTGDDGAVPIDPLVHETFDGPDGAAWPAPWAAISQAVLLADLVDGTGRLTGDTGHNGRMLLPGFDAIDVDARIVVRLEDPSIQGVGLYARHNGGALQESLPHGEGYAVYVEGWGVPALGVWREIDGIEEIVAWIADPIPGGILPGVDYVMRMQVVQAGAVTELRAKIWPAAEPEPPDWMVETTDASPSLQDVGGTFAIDIYNYEGTGSVFVDDLVVIEI